MKSYLNTRGAYMLAFQFGSLSPDHPNLPCFHLNDGAISEQAGVLHGTKPEDVLWSPGDVQPVGQEQQ